MNLKPEELIREAMRANPEEGIKELRKSSESTTKCCCAVQTTNEWYKLLMREAADQIERDQKEIAELKAKVTQWIPVTERPPEELVPVNVVWVNRVPEPYYEKIKGVPFSGTACFFEGRWYWDSPIVLDMLSEYGKDDPDLVDDAVDITHWMPLPEPPKEDNHDA